MPKRSRYTRALHFVDGSDKTIQWSKLIRLHEDADVRLFLVRSEDYTYAWFNRGAPWIPMSLFPHDWEVSYFVRTNRAFIGWKPVFERHHKGSRVVAYLFKVIRPMAKSKVTRK